MKALIAELGASQEPAAPAPLPDDLEGTRRVLISTPAEPPKAAPPKARQAPANVPPVFSQPQPRSGREAPFVPPASSAKKPEPAPAESKPPRTQYDERKVHYNKY